MVWVDCHGAERINRSRFHQLRVWCAVRAVACFIPDEQDSLNLSFWVCSQALTHQKSRCQLSDRLFSCCLKISQFLSRQHDPVTTVAIQCLETTFKISSSDCHLAVPQPLREIFLNSLLKVGAAWNALKVPYYAHYHVLNSFYPLLHHLYSPSVWTLLF